MSPEVNNIIRDMMLLSALFMYSTENNKFIIQFSNKYGTATIPIQLSFVGLAVTGE